MAFSKNFFCFFLFKLYLINIFLCIIGFYTPPEMWSKLLYGNEDNELLMECIINKWSNTNSFSKLTKQVGNLARRGNNLCTNSQVERARS
jgi:hypothetical protein